MALRTARSSGTLPATTVTARTSTDGSRDGEHERDRVVGSGVGVDHDAAAGHLRSLAANSGWCPPSGTVQNSESCPSTSVAGTTGNGVGNGARSPTAAATSAWNIRASLGDSRFSG